MIYKQNIDKFSEEAKGHKSRSNIISILRTSVALIFLWICYLYYAQSFNLILLCCLFGLLVTYLYLVKWHDRVKWAKKFGETKILINRNENEFVENEKMPFYNGVDFIEKDHDYSYDLDFFGEGSIYQFLNRAYTYIGRVTLADSLKNRLPNKDIIESQHAVDLLSKELNWCQDFMAYAKIIDDNKDDYFQLLNWGKKRGVNFSKGLKYLAYLTPTLLIISGFLWWYSSDDLYYTICIYLFIINLGFLGSQLKKIKQVLINSDKLETTIKHYGLLLKHIEGKNFDNERLQKLKQRLVKDSISANEATKDLSGLFSSLNNIFNPMGAIIFNGLFLYHIHVFYNLLVWRKQYGKQLKVWLEVIGEFEMLISLSNYKYNNPQFVFPTINENNNLSFTDLGHPLISSAKRVCNTASFEEEGFVILTGSNMSGKSTFLRTLGVNMVLAGVGSVLCAKSANIHPKRVMVSMRLSDSIKDDESYFYAEVKRLRYILNALDDESCFILLDEILRGTNSEDKQYGTIEVIKRIAGTDSFGAIATHDLEVCNITKDHPNRLANKCFEVDIIEDELVFDYKLREGVCSSKNASFLMKKMGVI